jgi:hypothetical protein
MCSRLREIRTQSRTASTKWRMRQTKSYNRCRSGTSDRREKAETKPMWKSSTALSWAAAFGLRILEAPASPHRTNGNLLLFPALFARPNQKGRRHRQALDCGRYRQPKEVGSTFRSDEIRLRSVLTDYMRNTSATRPSPRREQPTSAPGCIASVGQ